VYISAVTNAHENEMVAVAAGRRKKRMSDPNGQQLLDDTGAIFVTTSDGRYRRKVMEGHMRTNLELTCQIFKKEYSQNMRELFEIFICAKSLYQQIKFTFQQR
jgi:hypothetical protein